MGQTKCTVIAIYNTIIRIIMLTGKWGAVSLQCSVCEVFVKRLCSVCEFFVQCLCSVGEVFSQMTGWVHTPVCCTAL